MFDVEFEMVFKLFCVFGVGSKDLQVLMDNVKFVKFFCDFKLYDKKFIQIDMDIIFNRLEVKR